MTQDRFPLDPQRDVYGAADVALPTAEESAAADRAAREQHGVSGRVLMENAGRAAALVLHALHPRGRVVGVAGSGNNGGDLLVLLRTLHGWGREVALIAAGSRPPDPSLAHGHDIAAAAAGDAPALLARADVIVDGMLGTGAAGAPRGDVAEWIERINTADRPIVALDLPSGVDATTGAVSGGAVRAAVTVTFGWPKLGLLLQPARLHCGRLIAVEIGFPAASVVGEARALTPGWVHRRLRPRRPSAHKGTSGRLAVLAGSTGMAGAATLAAQAALRAGAGLVRIASSSDNRDVLQTTVPAATFLDRDRLATADLQPMHALLAGPGLGTDESARAALLRALELMPGAPTVLDADALNMLAAEGGDSLERIGRRRRLIITPHPLELARLTGADVADITADPVDAARRAARQFGCVTLLKGQPSLIAEPGGRLLVNTTGSSDLATGGMGDQLGGAIAALLAAGHDAFEAAGLGLFLCGRAADLCALGRSLSPQDVSYGFARAVARPGSLESPLGLPFITFDQPQRW